MPPWAILSPPLPDPDEQLVELDPFDLLVAHVVVLAVALGVGGARALVGW